MFLLTLRRLSWTALTLFDLFRLAWSVWVFLEYIIISCYRHAFIWLIICILIHQYSMHLILSNQPFTNEVKE